MRALTTAELDAIEKYARDAEEVAGPQPPESDLPGLILALVATARKVSRWVRVEDEMPENNVDVLVLRASFRRARPAELLVLIALRMNGERWVDQDGESVEWGGDGVTAVREPTFEGFRMSTDGARVTHWMPLPEPPA